MIGAGSVVFCRNLTGDILRFPEFRNATLCYMDIDAQRLAVGAALCRKVAQAVGAAPTIEATHDLDTALRGADFVINMVQVGGFDATLVDFEIPRRFGLNFTIADTTGPGGLFRALRTFPVLQRLCRRMEALCPAALLLNYANPMSMNMQTITRTTAARAIGLCHSVQGTLNQLMSYLGEDPADIAFTCAGINHMAFYLKLEKAGQDLYPRLFEAMRRPSIYGSNPVRFELMKRLGYFVTESSEHNAEYSPWFIPHGPLHSAKFNIPIDEYLHRCDCSAAEFEQLAALGRSDQPIHVRPSGEYGSAIIHAMTSGRPAVVYGNMPNNGAIANLAPGAIAEAPTLVDRSGPRLTLVGELPPQLVGYIQPHVTQHELFIGAATTGRREPIYQAAMFDPLTAATLTPDQIVQMCDELIAAHGRIEDGGLLPSLDAPPTVVAAATAPLSHGALRERWRARCRAGAERYLRDWRVIGPFPAGHGNRAALELSTPVEQHLAQQEGRVDLSQHYGGLAWKEVWADDRGMVDLGKAAGNAEWAVAYACATVMSDREQSVVLRIGSDDGVKIWVNGEAIHEHEIGRALRRDSDRAVARLKPGANQLLLKIDNYTGGWGFCVAVDDATLDRRL